jgi:tRNA(fMet)-specific endonuclease VapC
VRYILDTNICIYIAKHNPPSVREKFNTLELGMVGMSLITHAELMYGAYRSQNSQKAQNILNALVSIIPVVLLDDTVALHYADIRTNLESQGKPIGNNDLWIAAHVRSMEKILVTNNLKEFLRVDGLLVENWCET